MYFLHTRRETSIKNNMENLPVEVLEIVFHPLSKKEAIENCFNVNSKWFPLRDSTMISSPTEKGVVVIGGHK